MHIKNYDILYKKNNFRKKKFLYSLSSIYTYND